jgi:hypothetical protein
MTTLGKILVIVNLVFSLVTGFLIIMVFSTRTNWKAGYDKLDKYYKVAQASNGAWAEEVNRVKNTYDAEIKRLNGELAKSNQQITQITQAADAAQKAHAAELEKYKVASLSTQSATAELEHRRNEVRAMQGVIAQRDQLLLQVQGEKEKLRQDTIRANLAARNSHQRTKELMETIERLTQDNERLKLGGTVAGNERRPPEDIKGIVTDMDPKSGLVTISLGSDNGLDKGMKLNVYRLSPRPLYLGEIRIVNVNHHEAVGRPVSMQRSAQFPIEKGDTVASNIVTR